MDVVVPPTFQTEGDETHNNTKNLAANLFNMVVRCLLVDGCWKASFTTVVLDSFPVAIPYCMLDPRTATELLNNGLKFACPSKLDYADSSQKEQADISYVLNLVFCLYLLKIALTEGGMVSLEDAVRSDMIITCASRPV